MSAMPTKAALLLVPGRLVMIPAVKDEQTARAIAKQRGFIAWRWDKPTNRLYAKVKP